MKRIHILVILLCSTLLFSCERKPKEVLSEEKLSTVIVDLQIMNGTINVANINSWNKHTRNAYFKAVLDKNSVTEAQLDSSLSWYSKKPKELLKVYDKAAEKLKKMQEELEKGK
jgi:hypothetical protein